MRGALAIVHGSSHNTAAAMSFRTAFLAPEIGSVPRNWTPPSILYAVDWGRPAWPPSPPGSTSAILRGIVWLAPEGGVPSNQQRMRIGVGTNPSARGRPATIDELIEQVATYSRHRFDK